MKRIISESIETLRTVGIKVFFVRVCNYILFKSKRLLSGYSKDNIQKFQKLKNKYQGKRIFIFGNGPSLNKMPLYLLKNEYTMCFNRFFLMEERLGWYPDFFAITDNLLVKDMENEINNIILPKVKYAFFPDFHPSNVNFKKRINTKDNVYWLYVDKPGFSMDLPFCGINKTVVNAGIQVAAYMGFTDIYLLGVDMTFSNHKVRKINSRDWISNEDDRNHFDPRYFSKGRKYHNPTVDLMLNRFNSCKIFYSDKNVHIYNAGYDGELDVFPRVNFDQILNLSEKEKIDIFEEILRKINPVLKIDDFVLYEKGMKGESFKVEEDMGVQLIKSYILTHIPLGPFKGFYYYVYRQ